jgi:hypothetical protein
MRSVKIESLYSGKRGVLVSRRIAFRAQSLLREGELGFYPTTEPVICDLGLINIAVHIIWYQLGLSSACSIYYRLPTTPLSPARR